MFLQREEEEWWLYDVGVDGDDDNDGDGRVGHDDGGSDCDDDGDNDVTSSVYASIFSSKKNGHNKST